jgi:2-methylaconitate cis-trans-isomerase PrpF
MLETVIDYSGTRDAPEIKRIGFVRTARKLMAGEVYVPESVWPGREKHLLKINSL